MSIQPPGDVGVNPPEASVEARRSLVDAVHERVVELVLDPDLEPGAPLRIDRLARTWGVSQTPVREAMARAEAAGLVVREAMRGYRTAAVLAPEEFDQLMEMRLLVEPYCAARAASVVDAALADRLRAHHARMRTAPTGPGPRQYRDYLHADADFHAALADASGNRFAQSGLAVLAGHAHRFRRFRASTVDDAEQAVAEHAAVLDAVVAGDPDAAADAMRRHLEGVWRRGRGDG